MEYISAAQAARKWAITERSVRNYCKNGRIAGAFKEGGRWKIPADAEKPLRKERSDKVPDDLLGRLRFEKENDIPGGIYHRIQIDLTYNSNHIEGSRLTHDQTRYIFETRTIEADSGPVNVDDIVEAVNHFRCIDLIIDQANRRLSEAFIKQLHLILKSGTSDSRKSWFAVGDYKKLENEVGGKVTAKPEDVHREIKLLISEYNRHESNTIDDILDFHYRFERIHPFQDGNGRVGRLIMFKECLRNGITPFIIEDDLKYYYYRGLNEWEHEREYLRDTCLTAQDRFGKYMDYFHLKSED
ncbi:MAG: Fic family protein [Anaerovoracaceae bacterium]|nr:Fic family protein [Bacillota bacterium]MDY2671462.1 Fic family protein [Anaerovoracaceae bacterium]